MRNEGQTQNNHIGTPPTPSIAGTCGQFVSGLCDCSPSEVELEILVDRALALVHQRPAGRGAPSRVNESVRRHPAVAQKGEDEELSRVQRVVVSLPFPEQHLSVHHERAIWFPNAQRCLPKRRPKPTSNSVYSVFS